MFNFNLKSLLLLLQALVYASAAGTKGSPNNQWNQESPQQRWPQTKGPLGGWDDEVTNPQGRVPDQGWKLEDSIPGVPGQSYPNHGRIPITSFDCRKQMGPGYYADIEAQCQVFHICQADGRQNSFLCPTGTVFNQEAFVCDWWFNVNCADASMNYVRNGNLYRSPHVGIDGSKVASYRSAQGSGQGNVQQAAVGIPGFVDSGSGGDSSWPPRPQGQWPTNQGGSNQKGDNARPGGDQRRMGDGQRWQNRRPASARRGAGGSGQKGSRRGQNVDQPQQGIPPNQKGGGFQRPMGDGNQGWGQRGMNSGGINHQRGSQPNGFRGTGGNVGRHGARRANTNRGMNSNKGFDTNTWSIRAQNFQAASQDRKGSGSDAWPSNYNAGAEPHVASWPGQQSQTGDHSGNQDVNRSWNTDVQNFSQWDENIDERSKYEHRTWRSQENDYDY